MRQPRQSRLLTLLIGLLHLVVLPFASVADARLEREIADAPQVTVHVEAQGGSASCPWLHPPDCALCHSLTTLSAPAAQVTVSLASATAPAASITDTEADRARAPSVLALPRAPPAS